MDVATGTTELDVLLATAGKRGYLWHMFRTDQHGPEVLAGIFQPSGCADVFVFSDREHAHAYPSDSAETRATGRTGHVHPGTARLGDPGRPHAGSDAPPQLNEPRPVPHAR